MDPQAPEIPTVPPTEPPKPKDGHWITILAMALFVLAALGITAFLYYQNQQLKAMLASYQSQTSPTPAATTDPTTNWKTYTSTKYSFSFKYPQESTITKDQLGVDGSLEFNNFILFFEKTNDILTNYVNKLKETNIEFEQTTKSIGNLSTTEWIGFYKNAPTQYISFIQNGYAYNFGATPYEAANTENNSKLLTQILSTFKFLGASPSAEPKACTQEAKLCPDGSYVGRTGPDCEFAACP